jgi:hypothetical protein
MTNGANFNLTNKKNIGADQSVGHSESHNTYSNAFANASTNNGSEGTQGFNIKNPKNILSGPLHSKQKPTGSSHMD